MRRGFIGSLGRLVAVLTAVALVLLARAPIVEAISDAEQSFLALYFTEEELHVVSATRSLQSIERIAENIEVVTAADIELMNAHTLADVLNTVPAATVFFSGRFGSSALVALQGSGLNHVAILLDGVPMNDIGNNLTEVGFFPVADIARIEILKGPASSAWGSALGGVINVITKDTGAGGFQGTASVDYGTKSSAQYRAALSGRAGRLGYYLSGTGLRTDGLTEGFDADLGFFSAKLDYAVAERANARLFLAYGTGSRGDGISPPDDLDFDRHNRRLVSRLGVSTAVGQEGKLDLSAWTVRSEERYFLRQMSDRLELSRTTIDWSRSGAGLKYERSVGDHDLVAGVDYSIAKLDTSDIPDRKPGATQWAVYLNDTVGLGALTLIPGVRFDDVSNTDSIWSPSLGATYSLSRDLLLRATMARGFSVPTPFDTSAGTSVINSYTGNPDLTVEKIWSYQAGIEANAFNALWLGLSAFRHDLDNVFAFVELPDGTFTTVNAGRQRREGIEIGIRTVPVHDFTLAAAGLFLRAHDLESDEELLGVPTRQLDVSLKYDDKRSFRALLSGRHIVLDQPEGLEEDFGGFIFDLNLAKKIVVGPKVALEGFLSVHNLFNGDQYHTSIFPNPERWVEGGLRAAF